jgi:hypothetical protein
MIELFGEENIFSLISEGYTIKSIAETIGVPYAKLSKWLNDPIRAESYKEAKLFSAQALEDDAREISMRQSAEGYKPTSATVQAAKLQTDVLLRVASHRDRTRSERYTPPEERILPQLPQAITFVIRGVEPQRIPLTVEHET